MWTRNEAVEESFKDLHNFKPQIYIDRTERGVNKVKLVANGKEVYLTETLERGLTKSVEIKYNAQPILMNRVYDAEKKAIEILQGA